MSGSILSPFTALFSMTDEQAMWRVQMHDDVEAFARLVRRWEGPIQRLCTRMTGDSHRGEDLAQEAFVRVFARRKEYQPRGRFSTFLWRVAMNLCYDELRKINRRSEISLHQDGEEAMDGLDSLAVDESAPDARLVEGERAELVRRALLRLPQPYRVVVILRHYENLKFREIADVLEIPEGTVKSRMAEALTRLHQLLTPAIAEKEPPSPRKQPKRIEESLVL
ncbi:MAG: sigma-70 family RNA polymerase sigma factor [Verrucomicrobia bacterium]|nr:sigma-70 family RNA polymerase sigma factor [Verrucomicrobiota bacterium]